MDINQIKERLQKKLSESRYRHSIRVADTAKEIAKKHGLNEEKAYVGGLLHDCAREMDTKEMERVIYENGMELREDEKNCPGIWHAFAGYLIAKEDFGVEDTEVLDAILYHSAGDKNMGAIASIVYIVDTIEPERNYTDANAHILEYIRTIVDEDLHEALRKSISFKIRLSLERGTIVLTRAVELWNTLVTGDKRR